MYRLNGSVIVNGDISYVSQESWIQNKSLRDNVLFDRQYDQTHYNAVIDACALQPDIDLLSAGDMTEIGEKVSMTTIIPIMNI